MDVTEWWIVSGDYVIWPLRVVVCLKIGDLLLLFHCTRVKEREFNVRTIEVLISLLSVVGNIYAVILVDRVCRVTEGWIDDEQEGFRVGRGV